MEIGSDHTIINWRSFCRDICAIHYTNNPQKIRGNCQFKTTKGCKNILGAGHVVEIDENQENINVIVR